MPIPILWNVGPYVAVKLFNPLWPLELVPGDLSWTCPKDLSNSSWTTTYFILGSLLFSRRHNGTTSFPIWFMYPPVHSSNVIMLSGWVESLIETYWMPLKPGTGWNCFSGLHCSWIILTIILPTLCLVPLYCGSMLPIPVIHVCKARLNMVMVQSLCISC